MNNEMYKKRSGTAGVQGHLYETKLLSLLNFRAQHDDDIEEFHLATNVDLIGEFDDICFKAKVKGFAKQIALFVQCKHRETERFLSPRMEHDLAKYFESYLKIRRAFGTNNENKLFEGNFNETECLFIMYTNAKYDFSNELVETEYTTKLKELIGTSPTGSYLQPTYETKDVEIISKIILEEQIMALAELFAKLLNKEVPMITELVVCYHYILAQKVFYITDSSINFFHGHRIASFRKDFFDTNDHFVLIFKNTLYKQVLLRRNIGKRQMLNLLEKFFSTPTDVKVLSELIGTVIAYKNGKFEFLTDMSEERKSQLNKVSVPQSIVDAAMEQAARKILEKSKYKVPPTFGNKDLSIRGNKAKVERRLDILCEKIASLINDAGPNNIITIEESLEDGLLKVNGGLAGAVGNVFVPDENTKLMKFADNIESLKGDLAKRLYLKLQKEIHNLQEYKIKVKVKKFTKLSFDSGHHDENLVRDFLRQLIFFTNQSNQKEIGEILKQEIGKYLCDSVHLSQVKSEAICLKYHDAIHEWWIKPDAAEYLTKDNKHYEDAYKDIINSRPLISALNMIHKFTMQTLNYTFCAAAVMAFDRMLDEQRKTNVNVIVTDNCKMTVAKLTQHLKKSVENNKHVVLNLESISKLQPEDCKTLRTELIENNDTVIFVNYGNWCESFNDIVKVVEARLFIITKEKPNDILNNVYHSASNLTDLSDESQQTFLKNTKVIFQGEEVSSSLLVKDENTMELIEGDIFNRMLENEIIKIGMPIRGQNYDESKIKDIDRSTYDDVFKESVLLVTGMPGACRSSLLTDLLIKMKERNPTTWIVRINLVEYSKIFSQWKKNKTVIDYTLCLYFMSYVALGVAEILPTEAVNHDHCGVDILSAKFCPEDALITFGFKMFLSFLDCGKLLFLFDGFDEIFPHYEDVVVKLLKGVTERPIFYQLNKIWIVIRSYNVIKDKLEKNLGFSYNIKPIYEYIDNVERKTYNIRKMFSLSESLGYFSMPLCRYLRSDTIFDRMSDEEPQGSDSDSEDDFFF